MSDHFPFDPDVQRLIAEFNRQTLQNDINQQLAHGSFWTWLEKKGGIYGMIEENLDTATVRIIKDLFNND